jgi:hypothetical protein
MVRSTVLDPCFESAENTALCPISGPWGRTAEQVTLTAPLPRNVANMTGQEPWAMQLDDGAHCTFYEGVARRTNGMRLNYKCDNGLRLYGAPNHGSQPWTIFGGRRYATELTSQPIAIAWY